jgi:omega-amidase
LEFFSHFGELLKSNVQLCFVSVCDVSEQDLIERYGIIKSHLVTRAVENVMTIISVNSISKYQTAPTAVIASDGHIVCEAPKKQEYLIIYDYDTPTIDFSRKGRIHHSNELLGIIQKTKANEHNR